VLLLTLLGEPTSTRCYIFIDRLFVLSSTMAVSSMVPHENLLLLDPIQNHALRLCLGAFRTLPASSMNIQANEPSLYIRRRILSIQYSLRLGLSPSNPAYKAVFSPKFKASFSSKPNQIPTLGIRIAPELEKIGFKRKTVSRLSIPATPPWLLRRPQIDLSLHSSDKAVTPPEVFKVRFYEHCDRFKNFYHIYTDGSKMGHKVSAALCHKRGTSAIQLPGATSISQCRTSRYLACLHT